MKKINWGIIGCGDVTEVKSGPAFSKVNNSTLVAVMRRDAEQAEDYAKRHQVAAWYSDANKLINDPAVNAIYIATPPSSHEAYTIAAIDAGKPVYVELQLPKVAWRVDPAISGGGLFHDIAPHQLDLMFHFFGAVQKATGIATNQSAAGTADDMVAGNILFKNGVAFSGTWCFNVAAGQERDCCEIFGADGKISFSVFENLPIVVTRGEASESFYFDLLPHVQQPMIECVTNYFLGDGDNPCSGEEGAVVMHLLDVFTAK